MRSWTLITAFALLSGAEGVTMNYTMQSAYTAPMHHGPRSLYSAPKRRL